MEVAGTWTFSETRRNHLVGYVAFFISVVKPGKSAYHYLRHGECGNHCGKYQQSNYSASGCCWFHFPPAVPDEERECRADKGRSERLIDSKEAMRVLVDGMYLLQYVSVPL
jgi:hypothetical protein